MTTYNPGFTYLKYPASRISIAVYLSLLALPLSAQSIWSGAGTNSLWESSSNWNTAPVSDTATVVQFSGTATRLDPVLSSAFEVKSLTFNAAGSPAAYSLSGAQITLNGSGPSGSADSTFLIQNNSTATQTIGNNLRLGGPGRIDAASGNLVLNGNIDMNGLNGMRFTAGQGKSITVAGVISNSSATNSVSYNDTVSGGGTFYIRGQNTYTTTTNLWGGTFMIGTDALSGTAGAFGNSTGQIQVGSSNRSATVLTDGAITIGRNLRLSSAANAVSIGGATAQISTYSGFIYLGDVSAAARSLTLKAAEGGRVNFTGGLLRATGATGAGDSVTKQGLGIAALYGVNNTYSGTTTVEEGALLVNGTLAAGAAITVNANASLGGSHGTVNSVQRDVFIQQDGIFTPGDMSNLGTSTIGNFNIDGDLTLAAGAIFKVDLGNVAALSGAGDLVTVTGDVSLGGFLDVTALTGFGEGRYTLLSFSGQLVENDITLRNTPGGYTYALDFSQSGEVGLQVTAVPEPSTFALIGGALALARVVGARRRHTALPSSRV